MKNINKNVNLPHYLNTQEDLTDDLLDYLQIVEVEEMLSFVMDEILLH